MIESQRVSVVIPAFNEEEGIGPVVTSLRNMGEWGEVIVVDDGSTDATGQKAQDAGARVVRHPYNKGNGAAVKTGLRTASCDYVLLLDADGQHRAEDIPRLLEHLDQYDMVIGARASRDQHIVRAVGNAAFKLLASWLTGRTVDDLTSGFRVARREPMIEILPLLPNGFSYPTTSCLAFLKAGLNVGFVPVRALPRVGHSKIRVVRDGIRFLLIILKIVTLYSPLKIFFPISAGSLLLGMIYAAWNIAVDEKIPMGAALLIQLAVITFLFGLLGEQIASTQHRR